MLLEDSPKGMTCLWPSSCVPTPTGKVIPTPGGTPESYGTFDLTCLEWGLGKAHQVILMCFTKENPFTRKRVLWARCVGPGTRREGVPGSRVLWDPMWEWRADSPASLQNPWLNKQEMLLPCTPPPRTPSHAQPSSSLFCCSCLVVIGISFENGNNPAKSGKAENLGFQSPRGW